ncbi:hypothetical protein EXIGLDRAFT_248525 [Exidia glandulosa HHB12029]|uniref:Uncharacterized protein n=1 Tax=Exidia glandulosa HHB12029 TaxID=1314781 RepID=A0A165MFU1_EXIGL|nr:hypothetical protein EXIGLDRAFT_248525 [Exidia glandulosa HHB12029]
MPGRTSSGWAFSLRDSSFDDDDDDDDDDQLPHTALTLDEQLHKDIDLASREDHAKFHSNPWTIAKVNAASRNDNAPAHKPALAPASKPEPPRQPAKAGTLNFTVVKRNKPAPPPEQNSRPADKLSFSRPLVANASSSAQSSQAVSVLPSSPNNFAHGSSRHALPTQNIQHQSCTTSPSVALRTHPPVSVSNAANSPTSSHHDFDHTDMLSGCAIAAHTDNFHDRPTASHESLHPPVPYSMHVFSAHTSPSSLQPARPSVTGRLRPTLQSISAHASSSSPVYSSAKTVSRQRLPNHDLAPRQHLPPANTHPRPQLQASHDQVPFTPPTVRVNTLRTDVTPGPAHRRPFVSPFISNVARPPSPAPTVAQQPANKSISSTDPSTSSASKRRRGADFLKQPERTSEVIARPVNVHHGSPSRHSPASSLVQSSAARTRCGTDFLPPPSSPPPMRPMMPRSTDAYRNAVFDDADAEWSTLPPRSRPTKKPKVKTTAKFVLPLAKALLAPSAAPATTRSGYVPPPPPPKKKAKVDAEDDGARAKLRVVRVKPLDFQLEIEKMKELEAQAAELDAQAAPLGSDDTLADDDCSTLATLHMPEPSSVLGEDWIHEGADDTIDVPVDHIASQYPAFRAHVGK